MNAKTLEAVTKHGEALLAAFPNATEKNPVTLCRKLRRVETFIAPYLLKNCNEGMDETTLDSYCNTAIDRVRKLLGIAPSFAETIGLHVNRDPRGFALKLSSEWTERFNASQYNRMASSKYIHQDWGLYGIIAPDLNQ